jgi:hypothetical protein
VCNDDDWWCRNNDVVVVSDGWRTAATFPSFSTALLRLQLTAPLRRNIRLLILSSRQLKQQNALVPIVAVVIDVDNKLQK